MSRVNFAGGGAPAIAEEGARLGCEESRLLIESGDYEQACEALSCVWAGIGREPEVRGLDAETAADVLLAAGVAAGFAGKARGVPGAQEFAKDLIGRAMRCFSDLGLPAREADAQICLAVCYWREGAYDDARLLLRVVLEGLGPEESKLRLRGLLWLAAVEKMSARYEEALLIYEQVAPLVEASGDSLRRGSFHSDRGQILMHLGEGPRDEELLTRAADDFRGARDLYARAGHLRYEGYVENNLGYLLMVLGRVGEAHLSLDRAREIFSALGDTNSQAQVDDTRARVLIEQRRHDEAIEYSLRAIQVFERGDEHGLLAESLTTHATALARAGRSAEALAAFARAQQIADERVGGGAGERIALTMAEELAAGLCARAGVGFNEAVRRFEAGIIREALAAAGGRPTEAAAKLGLKHQTLAAMLNKRHARLLPERTEIRHRRRSLIRIRTGRGNAECRTNSDAAPAMILHAEGDAAATSAAAYPPPVEIETGRLLLRRFEPSDLGALSRLVAAPEVMRHIGREAGRTLSPAEAEELLAGLISAWGRRGFGRFAVLDKETGELIGLCGWKALEEAQDTPELFYLLGEGYWGRGLAAEAAAACLRYGFAELGMERVVALTRPEHAASRRVLAKLGMRCEGEGTYYGVEAVLYAITREEFGHDTDAHYEIRLS